MPRITALTASGTRVTVSQAEYNRGRAEGMYYPTTVVRAGRVFPGVRAANPIPAAAPEDARDPAASNMARIRAVYERELELEQEEGKRLEGARKMTKEYLEAKQAKLSPAFSRQEYRAHILSHALFPNIFNYGATHTYGGSS